MRNSRKTAAALAGLLSIGLVAAACGSDKKESSSSTTTGGATTTAASGGATTTAAAAETTTTASAKPGGTVTYAAEQEYTSYNNVTSETVLFANTLVLNPVLPRGPYYADDKGGYTLDKEMMESAEPTSTDPLVIAYKMNPKAVWSDGDPIDCDDFYLAWISENGKAVSSTEKDDSGNPAQLFQAAGTFGYEDISKVECSADGKTITTTYSKPYADWKALFGGALVPAHIVEQKTGVADVTKATAEADLKKIADFWNTGWVAQGGVDKATTPSGGPYLIDSFKPGESLTLVRNDKYWGTPGKPDTIVLRQVPDASAQPQALANNEVQVISPQPTEDLLNQIKQVSNAEYSVNGGFTFEHFDFNFKNPILQDKAVRQAFALCIDRQEIVDTLVKPLDPEAIVMNNRFFFPFQSAYKDNSGDFAKQDIAKSKSTLEAAGWTLGSDGIYAKGGQKLSLRIGRRDPNPRRQKTIELAIAQCKEAGFDLKEQADAKFNSDLLPAGDFDIALFAWVGNPSLASNTSIYTPPDQGGGQNFGAWSNPATVQMFSDANKELDEAKRFDMYNGIDKLVWDDMATIPLFQFTDLVASSKSVKNVIYNPSIGVTWNAQDWTVAA